MVEGNKMDRVSIEEAATRLGVSTVTIRRRIKRGELAAEREDTPSGFRYVVLLPRPSDQGDADPTTTTTDPGSAASDGENAALKGTISVLERELAQRNAEIERLLQLLSREQEIVRAAQLQLPATTTPRDDDTPTPTLTTSPRSGGEHASDEERSPAESPRDHSLLARLRRFVTGQ